MKLGHHDITETNHTGIDHRAYAVFYAADKHSIKSVSVPKYRRQKFLENKSRYSFCWLLQSCVTFIKCLLYPLFAHFSLGHGQM